MLQIGHLTITHKKDLRTIVSGLSFVLNPGDKAVLIGEEGNGKSTVLKWICDPRLVEDYAEAEGTRTAQGAVLGYLPQELPEDDLSFLVSFYTYSLGGFFIRWIEEGMPDEFHAQLDKFFILMNNSIPLLIDKFLNP